MLPRRLLTSCLLSCIRGVQLQIKYCKLENATTQAISHQPPSTTRLVPWALVVRLFAVVIVAPRFKHKGRELHIIGEHECITIGIA